MKHPSPACVLLLALFCGWGVNGAVFAQEDPSQQQTYTVRGSIVNKATGQAIARALVTIQGQISNAVFTDSDGRFEFDAVPAGTYMLRALRPGFEGFSRFNTSMQLHRIQVGPNMKDISISLLPTGTITGQITLSTSDSAEGIQVHLLRRTIQNGRAEWQQTEVRKTNSDGVYVFGNLPPGQYRVYTSGSMDITSGPIQNGPRWGFAMAYYAADGNTAIRLRPGQEVHADMMMEHEVFYPVTVMVTNAAQGGAGIQVYDEEGHLLSYPTFFDFREGVVHLNLPRGRYVLEGQAFGTTQMFGRREITVQNAMNVALSLAPMNPIQVNVRREFTEQNPPNGMFASGSDENNSPGINLMLHKTGDGGFGFVNGILRRAPGNSDNSSFLLENVRPGSYWVVPEAYQGYVASITSGGVDLAKNPLTVGPGGTSSQIDVVLRNDFASLKIIPNQTSTASGNDAPSAWLSIIPLSDTAWQERGHIPLMQEGTTITLPPGTYRIFAFDDPQEVEYRNSEAMSALAGKGQTVTLEPGGSAQISVDVIASDSLEP